MPEGSRLQDCPQTAGPEHACGAGAAIPIEADRRYPADTTAVTSNNGVLMEHPSARVSNLYSRRQCNNFIPDRTVDNDKAPKDVEHKLDDWLAENVSRIQNKRPAGRLIGWHIINLQRTCQHETAAQPAFIGGWSGVLPAFCESRTWALGKPIGKSS